MRRYLSTLTCIEGEASAVAAGAAPNNHDASDKIFMSTSRNTLLLKAVVASNWGSLPRAETEMNDEKYNTTLRSRFKCH